MTKHEPREIDCAIVDDHAAGHVRGQVCPCGSDERERQTRIIVVAKAPRVGDVKTRLARALGPFGAQKLASLMLEHTLAAADEARIGPVELYTTAPSDDPAFRNLALPSDLTWTRQCEGDLGERMAHAAKRAEGLGRPFLIVGTDCPTLDATTFRTAARALLTHDAVLLPVADGGYVLLGLNRFEGALFSEMPWSSDRVASLTASRLRELGRSTYLLPEAVDIDRADDLVHLPITWRRRLQFGCSRKGTTKTDLDMPLVEGAPRGTVL